MRNAESWKLAFARPKNRYSWEKQMMQSSVVIHSRLLIMLPLCYIFAPGPSLQSKQKKKNLTTYICIKYKNNSLFTRSQINTKAPTYVITSAPLTQYILVNTKKRMYMTTRKLHHENKIKQKM